LPRLRPNTNPLAEIRGIAFAEMEQSSVPVWPDSSGRPPPGRERRGRRCKV